MNRKILFLLTILTAIQSKYIYSELDIKALPEPYCQIDQLLPFDAHGWYGNSIWIELLFRYNSDNIHDAVEVGSWLGSSARHIALLLKAGGILYAVDTWQGSQEHYHNADWLSKLPNLYQQFLSNIIHAKLTDKIIPIRKDSLSAAENFKQQGQKFGFVYIDAAHDFDSVCKDIAAYLPLLKEGGILCGDDWVWQSVKDAVCYQAQQYDLTVYAQDNFWFFKKEDGYSQKPFDQDCWIFTK